MSYKVFAVIISAAMLCTMLAGCKDKAGDMNKNSLTIGTATTETASAATGEAAQGNGVNTNPAINGYTDEDLEKMDKSALDTLKDPEPTPEPNTIVADLYEKYNIEADDEESESGPVASAYQSHKLADNNVTWEEILDYAEIPVTEEVKAEYDGIANPVMQVEKALGDISDYKARKVDFSNYLSTMNSMLYTMTNNPMIYTNDAYSGQISEFRNKYSEYANLLAGDNPLITKDQLAELKQSIVDEYNFLTGNGFMVSTVDSNVAEQLMFNDISFTANPTSSSDAIVLFLANQSEWAKEYVEKMLEEQEWSLKHIRRQVSIDRYKEQKLAEYKKTPSKDLIQAKLFHDSVPKSGQVKVTLDIDGKQFVGSFDSKFFGYTGTNLDEAILPGAGFKYPDSFTGYYEFLRDNKINVDCKYNMFPFAFVKEIAAFRGDKIFWKKEA